jgi:hypothetical protein
MIEMDDKYDFSFTASSLRLNEMLLVASATVNGVEVDYTNDLGSGKSSTGKRMLLEFNKRIKNLTTEQLNLLVDADITTQKQLTLVSMCKSYAFIRDFIIEVIREKLLVYDYQITEGDYISFYRRKFDLHDEMEKLTDLTEKKIKQVTFKVLEQSGMIDSIKTKMIQPQFIDFKLIDVIVKDNPMWLKVLLMSDADIERAIN